MAPYRSAAQASAVREKMVASGMSAEQALIACADPTPDKIVAEDARIQGIADDHAHEVEDARAAAAAAGGACKTPNIGLKLPTFDWQSNNKLAEWR